MKTKQLDSMPFVVESMQPVLAQKAFSNPEWIFEPKWDGFRAICYLVDGTVRFVSRNKRSLTEKFPELQEIGTSIRAKLAVLDGEVVALGRDGMPSFDGLRSRRKGVDCAIVFYVFDLLYLDGTNLMNEALLERKRILKSILPMRGLGRVRFTDHIIGDGEGLFNELEKRGLEGMVAKRSTSPYVGGKTRSWLKIKTSRGRDEMRRRSEAWHGKG